ncbi:MAG TPA: hypothetical protein P5218_04415 [Planctomycetota bacterium]|nr:hypothetical protein [Planctomycetota bacterium]
MGQDDVPFASGSMGRLCLGGGSAIGRHNDAGSIGVSLFNGFQVDVDPTALPSASGPVAASAGQTWNFQVWYRDIVGGQPTSNFTDGVRVTFE